MNASAGSHLRGFLRAESGSGLVEFAFVAPMLLVLVFAIVDFGRAFYTYDLVANDARLGARYAMVRGSIGCTTGLSDCPLTSTNLQQHLRNLSTGIDTSQLNVTLGHATHGDCVTTSTVPNAPVYPNADGPGCLVTVTVSYQFNFAALSGLPFASKTMTSTSQVAISQ